MGINRRHFLGQSMGGLAAGLLLPSCFLSSSAFSTPALSKTAILEKTTSPVRVLGCRSDNNGRHFVTLFNVGKAKALDIQLPARGHGVCLNTGQQQAAVFARRPGNFVWVINLESGNVQHKITALASRHFYGHGVYTPNGQYLLCSENNFESGQGCIGVYEAHNNYKRVAELPSFGIGPHEIKLLANGTTLVVANGGIRTHPDTPRVKSNLATMQPNLAYIDIGSGQLLDKAEVPAHWHQLSIRHIDIAADSTNDSAIANKANSTVAIAMQFEGGMGNELPALVATHKMHTDLKLHVAPINVQRKMRHYCGSVSFNTDNTAFAVSAPRGGLVTYWSVNGTYLGRHEQADACGIAPIDKGFIVSDGLGRLTRVDAEFVVEAAVAGHSSMHWDNHLLSV